MNNGGRGKYVYDLCYYVLGLYFQNLPHAFFLVFYVACSVCSMFNMGLPRFLQSDWWKCLAEIIKPFLPIRPECNKLLHFLKCFVSLFFLFEPCIDVHLVESVDLE